MKILFIVLSGLSINDQGPMTKGIPNSRMPQSWNSPLFSDFGFRHYFGIRYSELAEQLARVYFNVFFRNFNPFTAISSRVGSMRRQIAAARAMTFTSVVNDSITTSPLYLIALSAEATDFQSM